MDREARQTVAQPFRAPRVGKPEQLVKKYDLVRDFFTHSKSLRYVVLFLALWTLLTPSASGQTTLKLATLVPTGSIWDKSLKQMSEEFKQATGGRFEITVYSGGTQGDEPTVLRKMRLDALQAGAFTNTGLGMIDPSFNVFNVPFFFESYEELNDVVAKLTPTLKKRAEAKGFILLNWGHGGWTQVFTKKPVQTVAEMKQVKLWTSAGNDNMVSRRSFSGTARRRTCSRLVWRRSSARA